MLPAQRMPLPATEIRRQEQLVATDSNQRNRTEDQSSGELTRLYSLAGDFATG